MAEQGAAAARMFRKHSSGTPRVTVRSNYVGLPSMAGRRRIRRAKARRMGASPQGGLLPPPEARSRGAKSPQWSAGWRASGRFSGRPRRSPAEARKGGGGQGVD